MYGLKQTDRDTFDTLVGQLQESRFRLEHSNPKWERKLRNGPKRAFKSVRNHPDSRKLVPESFLAKLEAMLDNTYQYQRDCVQPKEPLAVLCHGDFLRNNIAFKYSDEDKVSAICIGRNCFKFENESICRRFQWLLCCSTFRHCDMRRQW